MLWSHGRGDIKGDNVCHIAGTWLGRVASGNDSDLILSCTNEGKWGPGGLLPTGWHSK